MLINLRSQNLNYIAKVFILEFSNLYSYLNFPLKLNL